MFARTAFSEKLCAPIVTVPLLDDPSPEDPHALPIRLRASTTPSSVRTVFRCMTSSFGSRTTSPGSLRPALGPRFHAFDSLGHDLTQPRGRDSSLQQREDELGRAGQER